MKIPTKGTAFSLGLLIGLLIAGLPNAVRVRSQKPNTSLLSVVSCPKLNDMMPGKQMFCLRYKEQDFAILELEPDKGATGLLVIDKRENRRRGVSIDSMEGAFPGEITVDVYEDDPDWPAQSIVDYGADGIPDRRADWKTNKFFDLADIQWVPIKKSQTQPATTKPSSSPSPCGRQ